MLGPSPTGGTPQREQRKGQKAEIWQLGALRDQALQEAAVSQAYGVIVSGTTVAYAVCASQEHHWQRTFCGVRCRTQREMARLQWEHEVMITKVRLQWEIIMGSTKS